MKSRLASASTTRAVASDMGGFGCIPVLERTAVATPTAPMAAIAQQQGKDRARGEAPAHRHAPEDHHVDDVVAPEVEDGAARRLEELEPRELAVAAVENRVAEEDEGAQHLPCGPGGQEERRAAEPDGDADERDRVRGDGRPREPARHREREAPLEVARHEALGVLDQAPQQPGLGGGDVAHAGEGKSAARVELDGPPREPIAEGGDELGGVARPRRLGEHLAGVLGVHERHCRGIDGEGLRRHGRFGDGAEPRAPGRRRWRGRRRCGGIRTATPRRRGRASTAIPSVRSDASPRPAASTGTSPARRPASAMRRSSGRPATGVSGPTAPASRRDDQEQAGRPRQRRASGDLQVTLE